MKTSHTGSISDPASGVEVGKQRLLGFSAPKHVALFDDLGEFREQRVCFAQFSEIGDRGQRQIDAGVDQLFTALDVGQIEGVLRK